MFIGFFFFLLIHSLSFADTLTLPESKDWLKKEKIFGSEAILTKTNKQNNILVLQFVQKALSASSLDGELSRIVEQRKSSSTKAWSNVKVEYQQAISIDKIKGKAQVLNFTQEGVTQNSLVAVVPLSKSYLLIFGKLPDMSLEEIKTSVLPYLEQIDFQP